MYLLSAARLLRIAVALVVVFVTADCKKRDKLGPVPKDMRNLTSPAKHVVHYPTAGTFIPIEGAVEDITWMDSLLPFVNRRVGLVVSRFAVKPIIFCTAEPVSSQCWYALSRLGWRSRLAINRSSWKGTTTLSTFNRYLLTRAG